MILWLGFVYRPITVWCIAEVRKITLLMSVKTKSCILTLRIHSVPKNLKKETEATKKYGFLLLLLQVEKIRTR